MKKDSTWEETVHRAASFQVLEDTRFSYIVNMRPSEYTGFWRSTSYGSAYARTLEDPGSYWRELESRFAAASGKKLLPVDFSPALVVSRKI